MGCGRSTGGGREARGPVGVLVEEALGSGIGWPFGAKRWVRG